MWTISDKFTALLTSAMLSFGEVSGVSLPCAILSIDLRLNWQGIRKSAALGHSADGTVNAVIHWSTILGDDDTDRCRVGLHEENSLTP